MSVQSVNNFLGAALELFGPQTVDLNLVNPSRRGSAASRGIMCSTNRKNRVLRAPAPNDSYETSDGVPRGPPFAFRLTFRRDRVLRVSDLDLV
jgi:hypothetical protein